MSAGEGSPGADRPPAWQFAAIVLGLFVVFNANFRSIGPLDPIPATLLPSSLLRDGDADLSEFRPLLEETGWYHVTLGFGTLQYSGGRLISSYPLGAPLVALPLYVLPDRLGWLDDWDDYQRMGKIAASFIVALSAGFVFLAAAEIAAVGPAVVVALAYGLGTSAWAIASQALWQHGPGMLCLSLALFLLLRLERGAGARTAAGAGAALALAVLCRSLNVIPAGALGLFVLVRHRRYVIAFALPLACAATWQVHYNLVTYGDARGGYAAIIESQWHGWRGLTTDTLFTHPFWHGLTGLLVSPGKGLLVYTPYLAFALAALVPAALDRGFPLGRYLALWIFLLLIPLSKNAMWWGGATFGGRYLSEASVGLSLVLAWLWPRLAAPRWALGVLGVAIAVSVAVQALGAFVAPCGWHDSPTLVDRHPERIWDWSDTEIQRCIGVGLRSGLHPAGFETRPGPGARDWPSEPTRLRRGRGGRSGAG